MTKVLQALGITILAFVMSLVLMAPFSFSATALLASPNQNDFTINDYYNMAADGRAVRTLDPDVVIVDISDCDRLGTAQVLEFIGLCSPRAVGIDIVFHKPSGNDSLLIESLRNLPCAVFAETVQPVSEDKKNTRFIPEEISFFKDSLPNYKGGIVNLPTRTSGSPVREFCPRFMYSDGHEGQAFASAVACVADPEAAAVLRKRGNDSEVINFVSRSYLVYTPEEMVENPDELFDKVILVGAMQEIADTHPTPVKKRMSGVEIHARALSTILGQCYYHKVSDTANRAIAFGLAFFVIFCGLLLPLSYKGLVLRLLQVGLLYLIIRVGYSFFVDRLVIFNFSYSLLMVTFGLFAADVWNGLSALGLRSVGFVRRICEKRIDTSSETDIIQNTNLP